MTKCARVSMSIMQRLDGSRVRKEKKIKKTVQKDSNMHGSKQNLYNNYSGRERGWRETHVVGERFVIFFTSRCLALCAWLPFQSGGARAMFCWPKVLEIEN